MTCAPNERDGATFAQGAFRWVLSNPNVRRHHRASEFNKDPESREEWFARQSLGERRDSNRRSLLAFLLPRKGEKSGRFSAPRLLRNCPGEDFAD
jgi:hypothetical protein